MNCKELANLHNFKKPAPPFLDFGSCVCADTREVKHGGVKSTQHRGRFPIARPGSKIPGHPVTQALSQVSKDAQSNVVVASHTWPFTFKQIKRE